MGKALIIGCGGVASVAIHKCCQNSEVFEEICIASRTKSKCDALKEKLEGQTKTKITTAQVDANNVDELVALINEGETGCGFKSGTALSGSDHYGCLPGDKDQLCGYRQL